MLQTLLRGPLTCACVLLPAIAVSAYLAPCRCCCRRPCRAVAAVWPQAGLLQYFDPLPGRREGRRVLASLARWLLQDAADKGVALPCRRARQLRLEHAPQGMPVQVRLLLGGRVQGVVLFNGVNSALRSRLVDLWRKLRQLCASLLALCVLQN